MFKRSVIPFLLVIALSLLGGCAVVDAGGGMVNRVGQSLTKWGTEHDSSLIKTGGSLYEQIGSGIQGAARKDEKGKK